MMLLGLFGIVAFIVGSLWGKYLANKGITSDNALLKHQKFFVGLVIFVCIVFILLILIDRFNLTPILPQVFPPILLIYIGGWYHSIVFVMGFFILGLLLLIELNGTYNKQKVSQLILALTLISFILSILGYNLQPVDSILEESKIENGVVMQTAFFTCAPSAIATLSRAVKIHPELTEKEAIKYTKTNRFGTTTLREIKAMKQLDLKPEYRHNLTTDDLFNIRQPAILHVKERNKNDEGVRFSHAVALIGISKKHRMFVIGNPYYGLQIRTAIEMENYWFGEAIVANVYEN